MRTVTGTGYSLFYDDEGRYVFGSGVANPTVRTAQGTTGVFIPQGGEFFRTDLGYALTNQSGTWAAPAPTVGAVTATSLAASGAVTAASVTATDAITSSAGDVISSTGSVKGTSLSVPTATGANISITSDSEEITLATDSATTDSSGNLLHANSIILAVVTRVTTALGTAVSFTTGDGTTAARFGSSAAVTLGATTVGLNALKGGVSTDATGPVQVSAAAVRITSNATPSAGKVRVTVYYIPLTPPTS